MIGLGKWNLDVAMPLMKVNPVLIIGEEDGKYTFTIDIGGFGASPAINLLEIKEEGNSLMIKHTIPMLTAGELDGMLTFDGIYCKGSVSMPMFGKITFKGVKAED